MRRSVEPALRDADRAALGDQPHARARSPRAGWSLTRSASSWRAIGRSGAPPDQAADVGLRTPAFITRFGSQTSRRHRNQQGNQTFGSPMRGRGVASVQRPRAADQHAVDIDVRGSTECGIETEAVADIIADAGRKPGHALEIAERGSKRDLARARIVIQTRGGKRKRGAGSRFPEVAVDLVLQADDAGVESGDGLAESSHGLVESSDGLLRAVRVLGPKLETARWPAASLVTKLVGPCCDARLAAEVMPGAT